MSNAYDGPVIEGGVDAPDPSIQSDTESAPPSPGSISEGQDESPPSVDRVCTENMPSVGMKELRSLNGRFRFVALDDGSLILYMDSDAIWAIHTESASSPRTVDLETRLVVHNDGNLVLVHRTRGITWSSNTASNEPGPYTLVLRNDGKCILYDGNEKPRWATRTCGWV